MASANVSKTAVSNAQKSCNVAAEALKKASRQLCEHFVQAGQNWKDSKYKELGSIISECNSAINEPIKQLNECGLKLSELYNILEEYDNI